MVNQNGLPNITLITSCREFSVKFPDDGDYFEEVLELTNVLVAQMNRHKDAYVKKLHEDVGPWFDPTHPMNL